MARGILGWGGGCHIEPYYFGTCAEDAFLANTLDNVQVTDIAHCVALIIHYFVMVFILQQ